MDRHRGLPRERGDDGHLPLVERTDLVAPDVERPDDLVVDQHRCPHGGPEAGDLLEVVPAVLRIGQHVRDLLGPAVQPDPADQRVAVERHRVLGDEGDRLVGETGRLDQLVDAVSEEVEVSRVRPAEPARALHDGREDALGVGGRATQRREDLVGGLELVPQGVEIPSELLVLLGTDCVSLGARCSPPIASLPRRPRHRASRRRASSVPKIGSDGNGLVGPVLLSPRCGRRRPALRRTRTGRRRRSGCRRRSPPTSPEPVARSAPDAQR